MGGRKTALQLEYEGIRVVPREPSGGIWPQYVLLYEGVWVGGTAQYFSIFGKNPISKNLEIGPTIFDKRLLVKSPFDRVSDRNVINGKTPVIGLESPLLELQLVHAPPHFLAVSKQNAGECMFPGGSRACPRGQFSIAYVQASLLSIY